jgi:hypothetical protein
MVEMLARRFESRQPHWCATASSMPALKAPDRRTECAPPPAARPARPLPLFPLRTVLFPGGLLG